MTKNFSLTITVEDFSAEFRWTEYFAKAAEPPLTESVTVFSGEAAQNFGTISP